MSWQQNIRQNAGRARYAAAQGLRSAWYGGHMAIARRRAGGINRPGEPTFKPERGPSDLRVLRKAYFDLFLKDRANVEAGLYPAPDELRVRDLPRALSSMAAFHRETKEVDRRRVDRRGDEVREMIGEGSNRYPDYYQQNFHYQSDGWFSDESARVYDTQVEALFTGTAAAMRRAALAEIGRELRGRDQRNVTCLDLACGNGSFMRELMGAYPRLRASGLDLSPNYAEAAREAVKDWSQVDIVEGAAEAIPQDSKTLDMIVSIFLFHELPTLVRPSVIREVARTLKPGGLFILADSVQFGDYPELDGLLEYFPQAFHEPYYKGYLAYDFAPVMEEMGLVKERNELAFLTKVTTWRKQS